MTRTGQASSMEPGPWPQYPTLLSSIIVPRDVEWGVPMAQASYLQRWVLKLSTGNRSCPQRVPPGQGAFMLPSTYQVAGLAGLFI